MPWLWQLKTIWKVLTTGTPYEDEICVSKDKLKEFLDITEPEDNNKDIRMIILNNDGEKIDEY